MNRILHNLKIMLAHNANFRQSHTPRLPHAPAAGFRAPAVHPSRWSPILMKHNASCLLFVFDWFQWCSELYVTFFLILITPMRKADSC